MAALGCLAGSAPEVQWVTERNGGRLGEKAERGFGNELRGSYSHLQVGPTKDWRCGWKREFCKQAAVRQHIICYRMS